MTVISLRQRRPVVRPVEEDLASIQRTGARLSRQSRTFSNWLLILLVVLATVVVTRSVLMLLRCDNFMLGHDSNGVIVVWCRYDFSDIIPPTGVTGSRPFSVLPIWQTLFMCIETFLRATPALLILWFLHNLFDLFSKGNVFSLQISRKIRAIAWTLLIYATIPAVAHVAYYFVHMTPEIFHFEIRQIDALILGIVLFPIASVMTFGHEIERDREGFL